MNHSRGLYLSVLLLLPVFGSAIAAVDSPRIRQVAAKVVHQLSAGERTKLLSITFEIDNDSTAEVTIEDGDLRILTASGTLLVKPEIRQNGVGSERIRVADRASASVELLFEFVLDDPWSEFQFSWGARLARETRSGRIEFARSPQGFHVLEPTPPGSTRITTDVAEPVRSVHTVGSYGCPAGPGVPPDIWQFHLLSGWPGIHLDGGPSAAWPAIWGGGLRASLIWTDTRSGGVGCPSWSTRSCRRIVLRAPCRHPGPSPRLGSDPPGGPKVRRLHATANPRFPRPGEALDSAAQASPGTADSN